MLDKNKTYLVLNCNGSPVAVSTRHESYIIPGGSSESPSSMPLSVDEIVQINSNSNVFKMGLLWFEEEFQEDLYKECRREGVEKAEFLKRAALIEGVYVPSLYDIEYNEDGTVKCVTPKENAPAKVTKRIVSDMDNIFYPDKFVVPFIDIVHDRVVTEIFRGCTRGCRFCQACFLNRPIREKSVDVINEDCKKLCSSSGYDEISLCSLSSSDYSELPELLSELLSWATKDKINVALPSLRVDNFPEEPCTIEVPGTPYPYSGFYKATDTDKKSVDIRKVLPKTDVTKCTQCGECARICSMGAIDTTDYQKITGKCIKCGACIKRCPQGAKYFDDPQYLSHLKLLEDKFSGKRCEPELFIN